MRKFVYGVHPGVEMVQKSLASLKARTGKSLDEWIALVKKSGPKSEKDRREWLKQQHGVPTTSAAWIAERAEGKGGDTCHVCALASARVGVMAPMSAPRIKVKTVGL